MIPVPGIGVCIRLTESWSQQQWDYVLVSFGIAPAKIWTRRPGDPLGTNHLNPQVETVEEIDWQGPIVLIQPKAGRYVAGEESLVDFVHPENALYVFGGDTHWVSNEDLGDITIAHKVYIPTHTVDDLYSFTAGAIVFYDRMVKSNG